MATFGVPRGVVSGGSEMVGLAEIGGKFVCLIKAL